MNGKKIILFGAGIIGRRALNYYGAENIFCFTDNHKQGQEFCGKKVISFDELKKIHQQYDLIIAAGHVAAPQLKQQCAENNIVANVWGDMIKYSDYESNPEIAKYKDIHKGRRCFIIGTGPSLCAEDLDKLYSNNEISFSCNQINEIYRQTKWRPDYYVASDILFFKSHAQDIVEVGADTHFFPVMENNYSGDVAEINRSLADVKGKVHYYNKLTVTDENAISPFSPDPSRAVQAGGTVAFIMLQFAMYMGFETLYLLGVDCTHGTVKDPHVYYSIRRHFYNESREEYVRYHSIRLMEDEETNLKMTFNNFKSAKMYAEEHGIKIYNATRGGILEIFERIDFDTLF